MTGAAVVLVGAGPGDPELLTLRAEALLGLARIVVVDADLGALARRFAGGADVLVVPGDAAAIDVLLAAAETAPGRVVRLYRGDPWLHPAHHAERLALARAGMSTEAVAGVAVEIAAPALAGVPVHVRHLAVACTIGPSDALPAADKPARTLVGAEAEPVTMVRAVTATGDSRMPAALVPVADPAAAWRGPLGEAAAAAVTMTGPALLVVGAVCGAPPQRDVSSPAARPGRPDASVALHQRPARPVAAGPRAAAGTAFPDDGPGAGSPPVARLTGTSNTAASAWSPEPRPSRSAAPHCTPPCGSARPVMTPPTWARDRHQRL